MRRLRRYAIGKSRFLAIITRFGMQIGLHAPIGSFTGESGTQRWLLSSRIDRVLKPRNSNEWKLVKSLVVFKFIQHLSRR